MNYHVEHHMFPMVPYHRLPELHERIRHDLPRANTSMWEAYVNEVIPTLKRQLRDPEFHVIKQLPAHAKSFNAGLHELGDMNAA
jgi:fatty acid desaturase